MQSNIKLTGDTKLSHLLSAYPWLKDALPGVSGQFKLLHSPLGKVMANKATISEMSKRAGISEPLLIEKLQLLIRTRQA